MTIPTNDLIRKCLLALEEICGSTDGRFERSMALRFILAYLYSVSKSPHGRKPFDDLWDAGSYTHPYSKEEADNCRHVDVSTCLNGVYRAVGVQRTGDFMFHTVRQKKYLDEKRRLIESGHLSPRKRA